MPETLLPALTTPVYDTYWRFAAERQEIFFRKLEGAPPPWTEDPIIARHKFTNAYRASDRVSQYLIRHVIYEGNQSPEEVFFRTILFKFFNKIETWELLQDRLGLVAYEDFSFDRYDEILTAALASKTRIYSAAYIMPSGKRSFGHQAKHRNHLKLLELMMKDEVPKRISNSSGMREAFEVLLSYPMIGNVLGYQFVTDLNYSEICDFSEMEFVIPGPGALDGIHKCFSDLGGLNEVEIIRIVTDRQELEFERMGLQFRKLWGRDLQLIDYQNLFCELSKYARIEHPDIRGLNDRTRIKQLYRPSVEPIEYWFPPKWEINLFIPDPQTLDDRPNSLETLGRSPLL
ncbi:MAG: putative DNA base hypermodification protein [Chloroflexi bacterium]|nr:putative DNA base hypermodification protein [Chloroflexota bacterium]